MKVDVSNGELLDKYTILQIKRERMADENKLQNVQRELMTLEPLYKKLLELFNINTLVNDLLEVNKVLWDIEDRIREKEMLQEFDKDFISLARSVYISNDKRAQIKKEINLNTNSLLVEEKSYKGI